MRTIIRVKYAERSDNDEKSTGLELTDKELLVNINCPIKIILNYIRNVAGLNVTCEFDLCDEINCKLRNVSLFEPHTSGTDVLQADLTYLIVTYQRDANGQMTNLTPIISGKTAKRCTEILSKLRKPVRKSSSNKTGSKKGSEATGF